jgi:hypothetical protein
MHVRKIVATCVLQQFAAGGGVALDDECSGLAARYYAQILEAVDRQIGEGAVDRRVVDVALREVAGALGGNQESARHRLRSALQQSERTGDLRRVQYVLDGDRRLEGILPKPDRSSATDTALVCACGIQLIPISQYLCGVAERTRCSLRGGVDW